MSDVASPEWPGVLQQSPGHPETTRGAGPDLSEVSCCSCRWWLGFDAGVEANRRLSAMFVLSITLGLRPGELRKLSWDMVDLPGGVAHVWRSASNSGDTKTAKSKRSLGLP